MAVFLYSKEVMTMKIRFEREKETKNTVRFREIAEEGKPPIIGTLYLQKWFAGDSSELAITIEKKETKLGD